MGFKDQYKEKLAEKIIKGLNKRNMEGFYCETKEKALKKALDIIPEGSSVCWGGSESIKEAGLISALKGGSYKIYDRDEAKTPEEKTAIMREGMFSDFFIGSSNAVTYDGELINIDGAGNRVSAYVWGPENVLLLVSLNKAVPDVETGVKRVRNNAAAPNCLRLNIANPCAVTGACGNCLSESTICCQILVTRFSKIKGRIKVVLVGEDLGY